MALRCLFVSLALLLITCVGYSQTAPKIEWQHCYGGSGQENFEGFAPLHDHSLINTSDGGAAFIAQTNSDDGDVSGDHKSIFGSVTDDFWLVKTDCLGLIQWQKCFGGGGTDSPSSLMQARDGGFVLWGLTSSSDGDISDNHVCASSSGYTVPWIVKTDAGGQLEWEHCVGPNSMSVWYANSVIESDSEIVVAGSGTTYDENWKNHGQFDAFVMKFSSKGEEVWHKLFGGSKDDGANSIIKLPGGGYLFAGITNSNDSGITGLHGSAGLRNDAWIVRLDETGNIIWQKCYGGTGDEHPNSVVLLKSGFLIAGTTTSTDGDVYGNYGGQDGWVFTVDTSGNLLTQHCFGGSGSDVINSVIQLQDSNFVFAGCSMSADGDVAGLHRGVKDSSDGWVAEFTIDMKLRWQECLGGTGREDFGSVVETPDGRLLLNGTTESADNGDVQGVHPGSNLPAKNRVCDVWNVQLGDPHAGVEYGCGAVSVLYPNPATTDLHYSMTSEIPLFDALGRSYKIPNHEGTLDISSLPPGVYYISDGTHRARFVKE